MGQVGDAAAFDEPLHRFVEDLGREDADRDGEHREEDDEDGGDVVEGEDAAGGGGVTAGGGRPVLHLPLWHQACCVEPRQSADNKRQSADNKRQSADNKRQSADNNRS